MGLFASFFGCSDGRPADMSKGDIQNAALKLIYPLPRCSESWIGGTVEQCGAAQASLDARRREFESFDPPWMREAIMGWFDFAQGQINKAREDCVSQKSKNELNAYKKEREEERARANEILKSIGKR